MALGKNIQHLRKLKKLSRPKLAAAIGLQNDQAIYALEKRDSVRSELTPGLAAYFQVPMEILVTQDLSTMSLEEISKLVDDQITTKQFDQNIRRVSADLHPIPVISLVQAGHLKEMSDPYPPGAGFDVEYTSEPVSRWTFGLEIQGMSMWPEFKPGDRVIIDPELSPNPGDYVVGKNGKEEGTFKKYKLRGMDENGKEIFELVPLNDEFPTLRSDTHGLVIIGVMIEHRRKYRRGS